MSRRLLELIGVMMVILAVTALLKLAPVPVEGQAPTAAGEAGKTPAVPTPRDEPNLQGSSTTQYETPLQRPAPFVQQRRLHDGRRGALGGEPAAIPGPEPRPPRGRP